LAELCFEIPMQFLLFKKKKEFFPLRVVVAMLKSENRKIIDENELSFQK